MSKVGLLSFADSNNAIVPSSSPTATNELAITGVSTANELEYGRERTVTTGSAKR